MAHKHDSTATVLGALMVLVGAALGCAALTSYIALTYKLCVWVWNAIV